MAFAGRRASRTTPRRGGAPGGSNGAADPPVLEPDGPRDHPRRLKHMRCARHERSAASSLPPSKGSPAASPTRSPRRKPRARSSIGTDAAPSLSCIPSKATPSHRLSSVAAVDDVGSHHP